jgi:hypothetical protein
MFGQHVLGRYREVIELAAVASSCRYQTSKAIFEREDSSSKLSCSIDSTTYNSRQFYV